VNAELTRERLFVGNTTVELRLHLKKINKTAKETKDNREALIGDNPTYFALRNESESESFLVVNETEIVDMSSLSIGLVEYVNHSMTKDEVSAIYDDLGMEVFEITKEELIDSIILEQSKSIELVSGLMANLEEN